jgi:hypothetical protein
MLIAQRRANAHPVSGGRLEIEREEARLRLA